MNAFDAKEIASHFGFDDINEVHEISSGHINATYRLDTGKGRFILQRVNTSVFADPGRMMENISIVLGKIPRLFLVPALDGRPYYENGSGFYRVYNFIEDSITYGKVESEDMAWKMGRALREFHSALASVDGSALYETIPHFHGKMVKEPQRSHRCIMEAFFRVVSHIMMQNSRICSSAGPQESSLHSSISIQSCLVPFSSILVI